jgi:hypothetical protein
MIDEGELDWKIVAISLDDPRAGMPILLSAGIYSQINTSSLPLFPSLF